MQRQSISNTLAGAGGLEDRLADVERRYEEARDRQIASERAQKDAERKLKRAEARIGELEGQLQYAREEVDEVKEARRGDAVALLDNAKERLEVLHKEVRIYNSVAEL
jgi:chromosome segregation ATPase